MGLQSLQKLKGGGGKIAVIGAGRMGLPIGYSAATGFWGRSPKGWGQLVYVDLFPDALASATRRFNEGLLRGKEKDVAAAADHILFSPTYDAIDGADLVIAATIEDADDKRNKVHPEIAKRVGGHAIVLENSSTFPAGMFADLYPDPNLVLTGHYFNPPDKNPVLEIGRRPGLPEEIFREVFEMFRGAGRMPLAVKEAPAFALNPIFSGLGLSVLNLLDSGGLNVAQANVVCTKLFGVPLIAVMDMIGANPIMLQLLPTLGESFMPWFAVPKILRDVQDGAFQTGDGQPVREWMKLTLRPNVGAGWEDQARSEIIAGLFGVWGGIIDREIADPVQMDHAVQVAFRLPSPMKLFGKIGPEVVLTAIERYRESANGIGFQVPDFIKRAVSNPTSVDLSVPTVTLERIPVSDGNEVAIIAVNRLLKGNAINRAVLEDLQSAVRTVNSTPSIIGAVVTGVSTFFSSGADLAEGIAAALDDPEAARDLITFGKDVMMEIMNAAKPFVAAINGPAMGGGCELALHCHRRVAVASALFGCPEMRVGVIPGWRGNILLLRIAGPDHVETIINAIRNGHAVPASMAQGINLVDEVVSPGALLETAIQRVLDLHAGTITPRVPFEGPLTFPDMVPPLMDEWPNPTGDAKLVDLLRLVCAQGIEEASVAETDAFVQGLADPNARVGVENFIKTSLKTAAPWKQPEAA